MTPNTGKEMDLEAIRYRCEQASPGPWERDQAGGGWPLIVRDEGKRCVGKIRGSDMDDAVDKNNAEFLAHARQDIPALIREVERLRAEVQRKDEALRALNGGNCTCSWGAGPRPGHPYGSCPSCLRRKALSPAPSHQEERRLLESVVEAARADHDRTPLTPGGTVAGCVRPIKGCIVCSRLAALDAHRSKEPPHGT